MGNVQYPSNDDTAIYLDGKWVQLKPGQGGIDAPPRGQVSSTETKTESGKLKAGGEHTVSNLGDQYLVWKYKDGRIGMGNVQYPGGDEIEHIWVNGSWQKVVKGTLPDTR